MNKTLTSKPQPPCEIVKLTVFITSQVKKLKNVHERRIFKVENLSYGWICNIKKQPIKFSKSLEEKTCP